MMTNKFVIFSEKTASKSLWRMLAKRFGVNRWADATHIRTNEGRFSIGTTAFGGDMAFVVALESTVTAYTVDYIVDYIMDAVALFPKIFPSYGNKPLYGLIASVKFSPAVIRKAHQAGFYLAELNADTSRFKRLLLPPIAKDYNRAQLGV